MPDDLSRTSRMAYLCPAPGPGSPPRHAGRRRAMRNLAALRRSPAVTGRCFGPPSPFWYARRACSCRASLLVRGQAGRSGRARSSPLGKTQTANTASRDVRCHRALVACRPGDGDIGPVPGRAAGPRIRPYAVPDSLRSAALAAGGASAMRTGRSLVPLPRSTRRETRPVAGRRGSSLREGETGGGVRSALSGSRRYRSP